MKRGEPNRKANQWTARAIPVFLLAIVGYSSFVVTKIICVDYLLNPPSNGPVPVRQGAAIAILILYYLLLLPLLVSFFRLLQTVTTNPGCVPRSSLYHEQKEERETQKRLRLSKKPIDSAEYQSEKRNVNAAGATAERGVPEEKFWKRDIFICNYDGRPPFCSQCFSWKLDRDHHCSEMNRCVRKMDHFCPWVGGIISETSFKFFNQFLFYTALFTLFNLIMVAYFFSDRLRRHQSLNVHWILALAFAALFFLFGAGMFGSSFQLASINTTTVENLTRHRKVHYVAVYLPRPEDTIRQYDASRRTPLRTITYPRPLEEYAMVLQQHGAFVHPDLASDPQLRANNLNQQQRTFAIIETQAGMHPWDLGPFENLKSVLGEHLIDWVLPVKSSPCTDHSSPVSMYRLNPKLLQQIYHELGVTTEGLDGHIDNGKSGSRTKSRRRRRRGMSRSGDGHDDVDSAIEVRPGSHRRSGSRHRRSRRHSRSTPESPSVMTTPASQPPDVVQ